MGKEGEGTYTAGNGRQFTGSWVQNKLNGKSLGDLDKEAKRLGPPPPSSSTSISLEEERRLAQEKEKAEEEKQMKEKRDSLLAELGRYELLINEKENVFCSHIKDVIELGDPTLLLRQIDGILTEIDSLVLKLENDIDVTLLQNKMR